MNEYDRGEDVRLLTEAAQQIGAMHTRLDAAPIVGFMARAGHEYSGQLMWVGRAVNGAPNAGYSPIELATGSSSRFAEDALHVAHRGNPCPMRWVTDMEGHPKYNTRRSAFWQAARAVLQGLHPDQFDPRTWPSRLVWSNLYKASPERGWNPSSRMASVQRDKCRELLVHEVETFRPSRIVFATGLDWAESVLSPEVFKIRAGGGAVHSGDIELSGQKAGQFVIAPHPMGKNRSKWVASVLQAVGEA